MPNESCRIEIVLFGSGQYLASILGDTSITNTLCRLVMTTDSYGL